MFEPVLKEPREQVFVLAQSHHAVANVARRKHLQLFSQPA